jgi:hypothetical protein
MEKSKIYSCDSQGNAELPKPPLGVMPDELNRRIKNLILLEKQNEI